MPDSWVVTRKADGRVMRETWNASVAAKVNRDAYTVETAAEYLGRVNRAIRAATAAATHLPFLA